MTPGTSVLRLWNVFAVGSASMTAVVMERRCVTFCESMSGLCPETVTVSSTVLSDRSAFTVAVNPAVSSMPSRLSVVKPGRTKLTAYVPGRSSTMSCHQHELPPTMRGGGLGRVVEIRVVEEMHSQHDEREVMNGESRELLYPVSAARIIRCLWRTQATA